MALLSSPRAFKSFSVLRVNFDMGFASPHRLHVIVSFALAANGTADAVAAADAVPFFTQHSMQDLQAP